MPRLVELLLRVLVGFLRITDETQHEKMYLIICAQQRLTPVSVSLQSDQSSPVTYTENLHDFILKSEGGVGVYVWWWWCVCVRGGGDAF